MDHEAIERELYIEAAPELVFDVLSRPEHLRNWWPDEASFEPVPGSAGEITFAEHGVGGTVETFTVVEVDAPRTFAFRWTHPAGEPAARGNSYLVRFELAPSGSGTSLRMTETGFRERGWDVAVVEEMYRDHLNGWDHFLPRLAPYVATLAAR